MKQYSHDYTKPSEADSLLYSATRLMANDCQVAAVERINEARQLLQEYLSQDNMVQDNDVADGWVKAQDVQGLIRNKLKYILVETKNHPVEILSFLRGDNLATIATDGVRHISQEHELVKDHASLSQAIAYLEAKGYDIDTDNFKTI